MYLKYKPEGSREDPSMFSEKAASTFGNHKFSVNVEKIDSLNEYKEQK